MDAKKKMRDEFVQEVKTETEKIKGLKQQVAALKELLYEAEAQRAEFQRKQRKYQLDYDHKETMREYFSIANDLPMVHMNKRHCVKPSFHRNASKRAF